MVAGQRKPVTDTMPEASGTEKGDSKPAHEARSLGFIAARGNVYSEVAADAR
jgi:hypothetical protein